MPTDIVIAGAGVVGLTLAIALARAQFAVTLLGPIDATRNGRTVALLDGSVRMMQALGLWSRLAEVAAPLAVMRIVDDTGSLFRVPPVDFKAAEIGLPAFGYNVENADLVEILAETASRTAGLTVVESFLAGHSAQGGAVVADAADGRRLSAKLLVAADGARSAARTAAGIATRDHAYPQVALTTILAHDAPHQDVSTEFHTRQGPFTLVPLPGRAGDAHRSSLVWVMTPAEASRRQALPPRAFAAEIETRSRFLLGRVRVGGAVGAFPIRRMVAQHLVGPRLVLAGEAAHALPPIGAQGLNLSLRDAATLVDHLATAARDGKDPGSPSVLDRYARSRMGDVALRAAGVDALNQALLSTLLPVDFLRGAGLVALASVPSLRRAVMRQGLMPRHAVPTLMR